LQWKKYDDLPLPSLRDTSYFEDLAPSCMSIGLVVSSTGSAATAPFPLPEASVNF
jgi:hypothetical protein